eukprot:scaffold13148_cov71-Cyclotella_meneghiniana.AAC.1
MQVSVQAEAGEGIFIASMRRALTGAQFGPPALIFYWKSSKHQKKPPPLCGSPLAFGDRVILNLTAEIHALRLARQLMPITAPTRQRHGKCLQITCFNPRAVMGHHTRSPTTNGYGGNKKTDNGKTYYCVDKKYAHCNFSEHNNTHGIYFQEYGSNEPFNGGTSVDKDVSSVKGNI